MKTLLTITLLFFSYFLFAQVNYEEVLHLKNGSIIRGVIIEQIPNQQVKIKTRDGSVFVYPYSDIEKISKEEVKINSNPNYSSKQSIDQYKKYKTKGFSSTIIGVTFFSVGLPLMIKRNDFSGGIPIGRFIPGVILTATSIPLMIIGPINISKYTTYRKKNSPIGLSITPSIQTTQTSSISVLDNNRSLIYGGTLSIKFYK